MLMRVTVCSWGGGKTTGRRWRRYRAYAEEGVKQGRRPKLVGEGLRRSIGDWREAEGKRRGREQRVKGVERILGESLFVEEGLRALEEEMVRRYRLKAQDYNLNRLVQWVGSVLGIESDRIGIQGKYTEVVEVRSLFCYWAVRELGISATELAKRFGLSQPAVSISVRRGETIAKEKGLKLLPE